MQVYGSTAESVANTPITAKFLKRRGTSSCSFIERDKRLTIRRSTQSPAEETHNQLGILTSMSCSDRYQEIEPRGSLLPLLDCFSRTEALQTRNPHNCTHIPFGVH